MPITTRTAMRHSRGSGERGYPCGELSFFPRNDGGSISFDFTVDEEPIVIVAACLSATHAVQVQVTPDEGGNWVDLYVHERPVRLTQTNNIIYLPLSGRYRLVYTGSPIGRVTGRANTLTHSAWLPLVPTVPEPDPVAVEDLTWVCQPDVTALVTATNRLTLYGGAALVASGALLSFSRLRVSGPSGVHYLTVGTPLTVTGSDVEFPVFVDQGVDLEVGWGITEFCISPAVPLNQPRMGDILLEARKGGVDVSIVPDTQTPIDMSGETWFLPLPPGQVHPMMPQMVWDPTQMGWKFDQFKYPARVPFHISFHVLFRATAAGTATFMVGVTDITATPLSTLGDGRMARLGSVHTATMAIGDEVFLSSSGLIPTTPDTVLQLWVAVSQPADVIYLVWAPGSPTDGTGYGVFTTIMTASPAL